MNVAIIGASAKPDRYSYKAMKLFKKYGYNIYLVSNSADEIEGTICYKQPSEIKDSIHTVTMYVSEKNTKSIEDQIVALKPERIIFNPGSENKELSDKCRNNGIQVLEACTLVLLNTNQF